MMALLRTLSVPPRDPSVTDADLLERARARVRQQEGMGAYLRPPLLSTIALGTLAFMLLIARAAFGMVLIPIAVVAALWLVWAALRLRAWPSWRLRPMPPAPQETSDWHEWRMRRVRAPEYERLQADLGNYFWLPCCLCGTPTSGREWAAPRTSRAASVYIGGGHGIGICPACTLEGWGDRLSSLARDQEQEQRRARG